MSYNFVSKSRADVFKAGCLAIEVGGKYDVTCLQCCAYIGRLTGDQVAQAIAITAHRGGVLCPDCRRKTCDICGTTFDNERSVTQPLVKGNKSRYCMFCYWDSQDGQTC